MRFGLTVAGGAETARFLATLPANLQKRAWYTALHRSAQVIEAAVKAAAPVGTASTRKTRRVRSGFVLRGRNRTKLRFADPVSVSYDYGRLRANIRRRRQQFNNTGQIAVSVTRGRAFWAFFLEQGTRRMAARPFWQAASKRAEAQARAAFETAYRAALLDVARRSGAGR
jgi:HK97 gp10 family phage protein